MKNSKLRKALMLLACAVMLVCLSVGATLAYLTSATEVVKNTFVVGEGIAITLDEAAVYDPEAELEDLTQFGQAIPGADRVMANTYKIVPNWEYGSSTVDLVDKITAQGVDRLP